MRTEKYREYLQEQGMTGDEIEKRQRIIGDFINFLTAPVWAMVLLQLGKPRWRNMPGRSSLKGVIL